MKFVNNWERPLELAGAATSAPLDLPDGEYQLTATRNGEYEIISATVVDGEADLVRGQEGTEARDWPPGSFIYCSLTAGTIAGLFATIADLTERVAALEPPPGPLEFPVVLTVGAAGETPGQEGWLGYISWTEVGACDPDSIDLEDSGLASVILLAIMPGDGEEPALLCIVLGATLAKEAIVLELPGIGELAGAEAAVYESSSEGAETSWSWEVPADSWAEDDVIDLVIKITL